jgi:hypothetical protein
MPIRVFVTIGYNVREKEQTCAHVALRFQILRPVAERPKPLLSKECERKGAMYSFSRTLYPPVTKTRMGQLLNGQQVITAN